MNSTVSFSDQTVELSLRYKGARDYLHGSDFYNAIQAIAASKGEPGYVSAITFKHFARNQCDLVFDAPDSESPVVAFGTISGINGFAQKFWVVESDRPVADRYPFDEDSIVVNAALAIEAHKISLATRTHFSPIEEVIALTKRLNYALMPDVDGKWVFGQLNLSETLATTLPISVHMKSALKGRFSINEIEQGEKVIGTIRFIVGKP